MAVVDFTTFTENDASAKLTVTSTKADAANATALEVVNLYKDYGADYFDAVDADFDGYMTTSSGTNNATFGVIFSSTGSPNSLTIQQIGSTDIAGTMYKNGSTYEVILFRGTGVIDRGTVSSATLYYLTLSRATGSDTVNLYIYSNSGRTTLVDTLTCTGVGTGTKWRYVYGFANRKFDEANGQVYGYIQNLDLNIAPSATFTPRVSFIM